MTIRESVRRCLFLLLILGLAACEKFEIVEPVQDSIHTTPPPQFRVTYTSQPETLPIMALNGFNVTSHFTAGATEATAPGTELEQYLKEGYNVFQVSPPLGTSVKFLYDTIAPV